jgi:N-acetylmuramoyl-L-alanine amidase
MKKFHQVQSFLLLLLCIFITVKSFSVPPGSKNNKPMIVVIDPGHGGKDPGAINKGIREKDIVLGIGLKLGKMINENFPEVKVVYTRNSDVFIPLIDRSRIANKNKADLFISIHANSGGAPSTRGTETFVLGLHRSNENLEVAKKENSVILLEDDYTTTYEGFDPNLSESYIMFELVQDLYMDQSVLFADAIQNQFKARLETNNRGVKQAGLLVLRQSSMPSVLIEVGFLSNQAEANYLNGDEGQRNVALSILEAFRKFKGKSAGSPAPVLADAKSSVEVQAPVETKMQEKTAPPTTEPRQQPMPVATTETEKPAVISENKEIKPEVKAEAKPVEKTGQKQEVKPVQVENNNASTATSAGNIYFSVQIGANTTPLEPIPANFKGVKDVRREKTDKYYRYFVGTETTLEKITPIWQQIKTKFPQSFIVSFVDGKRTIINEGAK